MVCGLQEVVRREGGRRASRALWTAFGIRSLFDPRSRAPRHTAPRRSKDLTMVASCFCLLCLCCGRPLCSPHLQRPRVKALFNCSDFGCAF